MLFLFSSKASLLHCDIPDLLEVVPCLSCFEHFRCKMISGLHRIVPPMAPHMLEAHMALVLCRLVHRLDKDASGCLVIARTSDSAAWLSQAFAQHSNAALHPALVHTGTAAMQPSCWCIQSTACCDVLRCAAASLCYAVLCCAVLCSAGHCCAVL